MRYPQGVIEDLDRPRVKGHCTNLWELIQAAYEEDRLRLQDHQKDCVFHHDNARCDCLYSLQY